MPITPFPKMSDIKPEDMYDVRQGYGNPIDVNKPTETWWDIEKASVEEIDSRQRFDIPQKYERKKVVERRVRAIEIHDL